MSAVFLPLPRGEGWGEGGLRVQEPSAKYLAQTEPALLRGFELLAADAGGAAKLRELILSLAMSGHLLPQQPRDEPASALLVEIRRIKELREVSVGRRRKAIALHSDTLDEDGRSQPRGWTLATASDLFDVVRGVTYQKQDAHEVNGAGLVPLLRANNIQRTLNFEGLVYVPENLVSDEQRLVAEDFVVCMASGSRSLVGKAARFLEDGCYSFGAFCGVVRPFKSDATPILSVFFASRLYRDEMSNASAGIGINNLKSTTLAALKIPLPPLAEQHRIVSRVEELMKLCDALEQSGRLADAQHARLTSTLFDALAASESAHALAENWQRIAEHFDLLLDRPEAIDALEQTILQLAVRGLLVPQDARDEPADGLLCRVGEGRKQLYGNAGSSTGKEVQDVTYDERPFISPEGWLWVRIESICEVQGGIQKTQLRRPVKNHFPYLRVANVQRDRLVLDRIERYELTDDEVEKWALKTGDLLVVEGNGSADEIGRCAIWDGSITPCVFQNHLMRVRPDIAATVEFLKLFLNSPDGVAEMKRLAITTSGLYNLSVGKIRNIPVPLPPLAEQHRIVARVGELRRLCAQLRERLIEARHAQALLADALVAQATTA